MWAYVGIHFVLEASLASRRRLLRCVRACIPANRTERAFVGGDFNTVVGGDGRLYPATWGVLLRVGLVRAVL